MSESTSKRSGSASAASDAGGTRRGRPKPSQKTRSELTEQVSRIEKRQFELEARFEDVADAVQEAAAETARALKSLRVELLGERRALATRSVFNAVLPAIDALGAMSDNHLGEGHHAGQSRARAISATLSNVLQSLGFSTFEAEVGEPFDPARMEALGYGQGERGVVLDSVRPGYRAQEAVVRPAGVLIADPDEAAEPPGVAETQAPPSAEGQRDMEEAAEDEA